MKKTLLIGAALLVGASGFAQNNRSTGPSYRAPLRKNQVAESNAFPVAGTKHVSGPVSTSKSASTCSTPLVTTAPNVLTVSGGSGNNCMSYNKDLNAVSWVHRVSANWTTATDPTFTHRTSGSIQGDWLNVTTGAWDSTIIYVDTTGTGGGRYPGGTIFNPAGNTTLANAYMVAAGPHVGSAFDGVYYAARQLSGSFHTQPGQHTFEAVPGAGLFANIANNAVMTPALDNDMLQAGGKVWVAGPLGDPAYTTQQGLPMKGGIFGKATTPYAGGNLTWTSDSIIPGFHTDGNLTAGNGYATNGATRIAFDPTGQIGYCVFVGRLATNYNNSADSMMSPIVYKTTNGGTSWSLILPGYNWRVGHPECFKNVCAGRIKNGSGSGGAYRPNTNGAKRFSFNDQHGSDLTVDANGILHYVSCVADSYLDGMYADSVMYTYTYNWDNQNYHAIIWDFMTDGTCWKTLMVDSIMTAHMGITPGAADTTSAQGLWYYSPNSDYMGYGAEINVSRSTTGQYVFYGWSDTDPSTQTSPWNTSPDLYIKGLDLFNNKLTSGGFGATPNANITNGVTSAFFPRLSDVSYWDATQSKWVVPAMTTVGTVPFSPGVWDAIQPVEFHYVNCAAFGAANFTVQGVVNPDMVTTGCTIGIKTNNNFVNSVSNYPNPFNHTTNIVVNLNDAKPINVQVFDAIGNLVYNKTTIGNIGENTIVFDATNVNAGVYYYTVTAGFDKVSKKMVIQK